MSSLSMIEQFPEDIRKELRADRRGRIYCSRKGFGRIAGVDATQIRRVLAGGNFEPETAELVDLPEFDGVTKWLTESQVRKLAKHFAFKAKTPTEEAEQFYDLIAAIGWRVLGQKMLGWSETDQMLALIERHYPAIPERWRKVYCLEFFEEIRRIYGYVHGTPQMGKWINSFVYSRFPEFQVRLDEVNPRRDSGRRSRVNTCHMSDEAKEKLEKHLDVVLAFLRASRNPYEFEEMYSRNFKGLYQLALFGS